MNKFLLLTAILLCFNLYSQQIKILNGDFDFITERDTINLIFEYESLKLLADSIPEQQFIENRIKSLQKRNHEDAHTWEGEWQVAKQRLWPENFIRNLNRVVSKKNRLHFEQGLTSANYTLLVKTNWIYTGWHGGFMNQNAKVKATLQFVETSKPEIVLLELESFVHWGVHSNLEKRLGENYAKIGTLLGRVILKNRF
ncbi:hypothetical protein [Planktosalinus lacus]|uniref:Uncharacterized protein n=1 Tax=Planktosalinus lacus TaxID=1526573 RepID=A0A8J2Y4S7_9FLAO|nr:hypothetical protein [Planktosalinus lacus]GGD80970.1 hypothetical protein GCM10011312_01590 [Planktosalinus lacus]